MESHTERYTVTLLQEVAREVSEYVNLPLSGLLQKKLMVWNNHIIHQGGGGALVDEIKLQADEAYKRAMERFTPNR